MPVLNNETNPIRDTAILDALDVEMQEHLKRPDVQATLANDLLQLDTRDFGAENAEALASARKTIKSLGSTAGVSDIFPDNGDGYTTDPVPIKPDGPVQDPGVEMQIPMSREVQEHAEAIASKKLEAVNPNAGSEQRQLTLV